MCNYMTMRTDEHYTIISADCHAGGSHEMYREYLEERYVADFDAWREKYKNPWKDLRDTDLFGMPVPGMAVLFIEGAFGFVGPPCVYLTATDTRTGEVLGTFPGPGDAQQCIFQVGGQKYR